MNLFILQMIALVSYGNAYLKGKKIPSDFYPSHPVFSPCARILFCGYAKLFPKGPFKGLTGWIKRLFSKRETVKIDIDQPDRWFEFLKGQGCRHLRLRHIPLEQKEGEPKEYQMAGFVLASKMWVIETALRHGTFTWPCRWGESRENTSRQKPWIGQYRMEPSPLPRSSEKHDLPAIKKQQAQALSEIAQFAFQQNLPYWGGIFQKALETLHSDHPEENHPMEKDIPCQNYSLIARQVIFGAFSSWVFGAMGSWNDLGFEDRQVEHTYDRLSENLYRITVQALLEGVNSY